jgi:chitin synthase
MDCGAIPGKDSIFKLIMAMEADPKLGGVCGNMRIEEEKESDK